MYKKVTCAALMGINGYLVSVEVDVSDGFPRFDDVDVFLEVQIKLKP